MIELIGWLGGVLLAACGLPLAISAIIKGSDNTNVYTLLMWMLGEVCFIVYTLATINLSDAAPLLFNYGLNVAILLVVLKYHFFPRIVV